jgi:hypothetical protein
MKWVVHGEDGADMPFWAEFSSEEEAQEFADKVRNGGGEATVETISPGRKSFGGWL